MPDCAENEMPFAKMAQEEIGTRFDSRDVGTDEGSLLSRQIERRLELLNAELEKLPETFWVAAKCHTLDIPMSILIYLRTTGPGRLPDIAYLHRCAPLKGN